jgi:hypothetical protein
MELRRQNRACCCTAISDRGEVAATLVDLSVKRFLSITDATPQSGGSPSGHDLVFRRLRPEAEWQELAPFEKTLMRQAFRDRDWTTFSQLRHLLPEVVPAMQEQIKISLWEKGMFRSDPNNTSTPRWKSFIYVASLMGMLDGLLAGKRGLGLPLYEYPGLAFLMVAITTGIIVWALQDPTNLNEKGARARAYLEGLRQFIAAVDADRLRRLGALPVRRSSALCHRLWHRAEMGPHFSAAGGSSPSGLWEIEIMRKPIPWLAAADSPSCRTTCSQSAQSCRRGGVVIARTLRHAGSRPGQEP